MRLFSKTVVWLFLLSFVVSLQIGCGDSKPDADNGSENENEEVSDTLTAKSVLDTMLKAYRDAKSYEDSAVMQRTDVARHEHVERELPPGIVSIAFERPNKLRLQRGQYLQQGIVATDLDIASDGKRVYTMLVRFPNQMLEGVAPVKLTAKTLAQNPEVNEALLSIPLHQQFPQLDLLISETSNVAKFKVDDLELLDPQEHSKKLCDRVAAKTPSGNYVYWINQKTHLLERLDFPTGGSFKESQDPNDQLKSIKLWIDFGGPVINKTIANEAFTAKIPKQTSVVRRWVKSKPTPVTSEIGAIAGEFELLDPSTDAKVSEKDFEGKALVFYFWDSGVPRCKELMPRFEEVHQKFADNDKVQFLAVSADDPNMPAADLQRTLKVWGSKAKLLRLTDYQTLAKFKIGGMPSFVVLDGKRKIHFFSPGSLDAKELTEVVEQLLDGKDAAQNAIEKYNFRVKEYERELKNANSGEGEVLIEIDRPEIAKRSDPSHHTLKELWSANDVKKPSDVLVIQEDGKDRVFVIEGDRTVTEIGPGETKRYELDLPEGEIISFLRTATLKNDKRIFLASGNNRQKLHLFDEKWKRTMSFPDSQHAGIGDVQLVDLDLDGEPEIYVGYWGVVGVHRVSLEGKRTWKDRSLNQVNQIGIHRSAKDSQIWCLNSRGTIVPINRKDVLADIRVGNRAIIALGIGSEPSLNETQLCGISATTPGVYVAVGFDESGKELWHYTLPKGDYQTLAPEIISCILPNGNFGWVLPATDGSIHLLNKNGELVDRFNHGSSITGIASIADGSRCVLVISSPDGVAAWEISPKN